MVAQYPQSRTRVVVFAYDTRLPQALKYLRLPVTVLTSTAVSAPLYGSAPATGRSVPKVQCERYRVHAKIAPMRKIIALSATALTTAVLLSGTSPAQARPNPVIPDPFDKRVRCTSTDADGRKIVTRYGNSQFGWNHFTHRHNIKKCAILNAALKDKVDRNDGHGRLEYDGVAIKTGGKPAQVKFVVIVQYTRKTKDGRYDAGKGQKIGVVNAFCRNQPNNKCPAWMNQ
ncbi:hypothetical protein [Streptomyces sp. NPDC056291]|uniref:hypothetical protein n=1 Tax=Streptomyces sp. NPDC056291 TaxID=3345772 RepID=UPI0035DF85DE